MSDEELALFHHLPLWSGPNHLGEVFPFGDLPPPLFRGGHDEPGAGKRKGADLWVIFQLFAPPLFQGYVAPFPLKNLQIVNLKNSQERFSPNILLGKKPKEKRGDAR